MTTISRQASVEYSCQQMYSLVADIDAYKNFLPGCVESIINHDNGGQVRATLRFQHKGVSLAFTTINQNTVDRLIEMELIEGPFKHLQGKWSFIPVDGDSCKVELEMDFDFSNRLYASMFKPAFNRVALSLLDAFIERAHQMYGSS